MIDVWFAADPIRTGDNESEVRPANNWMRVDAGPMPKKAVEAVPNTAVVPPGVTTLFASIVPLLMRIGVALVGAKLILPCAITLAAVTKQSAVVMSIFFMSCCCLFLTKRFEPNFVCILRLNCKVTRPVSRGSGIAIKPALRDLRGKNSWVTVTIQPTTTITDQGLTVIA